MTDKSKKGLFMDRKVSNRKAFLINLLYVAAIIALIFLAFKYALGYLAPFLISFLVAAALHPLIRWIAKKTRIKASIAGIVVALLFWVVMIALILLILYLLTREAIALLGNMGDISHVVQSVADQIEIWLEGLYASFNGTAASLLDSSIDSVTKSIINFTANIAGSIVDFATYIALKLPSVLLFLLVTVLSSVFLCSDYTNVRTFLSCQLPPRYYSKYVLVRNFIGGTIGKFIRAYGLIMCITFCELLLSFSILKLNYAVLLALLITIFDVLPYVGCSTVLIPWGVISIALGNISLGIGLLVTSIVIGIVRNTIEPKIVGKQIGLHPLIVLVSIYIGGKILGLIGIFIFPITIMFIKMLKEEGYIRGWKSVPAQQQPRPARTARRGGHRDDARDDTD